MNAIDIQYYPTRIGEFILGSFDGQLVLLDFRYRKMRICSIESDLLKNNVLSDQVANYQASRSLRYSRIFVGARGRLEGPTRI